MDDYKIIIVNDIKERTDIRCQNQVKFYFDLALIIENGRERSTISKRMKKVAENSAILVDFFFKNVDPEEQMQTKREETMKSEQFENLANEIQDELAIINAPSCGAWWLCIMAGAIGFLFVIVAASVIIWKCKKRTIHISKPKNNDENPENQNES